VLEEAARSALLIAVIQAVLETTVFAGLELPTAVPEVAVRSTLLTAVPVLTSAG
jgi:hypothetical protein